MTEIYIFGVRVRVDISFLAIIALAAVYGRGEKLASAAAVCAVHEFGHIIALYLVGGSLRSVTFLGAGIKLEPDRSRMLPMIGEALVLISGPLANVLMSVFSGAFGKLSQEIFAFGLGAAFFNLLPYRSLDGGSLILLLSGNSPTAVSVMRFLQFGISGFLLVMCLFGDMMFVPFFVLSVMYLFLNEIS